MFLEIQRLLSLLHLRYWRPYGYAAAIAVFGRTLNNPLGKIISTSIKTLIKIGTKYKRNDNLFNELFGNVKHNNGNKRYFIPFLIQTAHLYTVLIWSLSHQVHVRLV